MDSYSSSSKGGLFLDCAATAGSFDRRGRRKRVQPLRQIRHRRLSLSYKRKRERVKGLSCALALLMRLHSLLWLATLGLLGGKCGGLAAENSSAPFPVNSFYAGAPDATAGGIWDLSAPLETARQDFKAVLLSSGPLQGKVLAVGGCCSSKGSLSGSEIYDPEANAWQKAGNLHSSRWLFQAVPISNGSALAVGGLGVASGGVLNSTELFIPTPNGSSPFGSWQEAAAMNVPRQDFELVALGDGRVLAAGGFMASAEIFDPAKNSWTRTASMTEARSAFQAVLLKSGRVLAIGGRGRQSGVLASSELFDLPAERWDPQGDMSYERAYFAAAELADGRVLVAGGKDAAGQNLNSSEIYDPGTGNWTQVADMTYQRSECQAVPLPGGEILVVGGLGGKSTEEISILDTAEVYEPSTGQWTLINPMINARYVFQLVAFSNSSVLALGGTSMSGYTASTEIFGAS